MIAQQVASSLQSVLMDEIHGGRVQIMNVDLSLKQVR